MAETTQDMPELTIHIYSFGYQYSGVPAELSGAGAEDGGGGGFVFDCRALPNPFWEEALRPFRGTDPAVVDWFAGRPEVDAFAGHAAALVRMAAAGCTERGRRALHVGFGCTGGRHRSVYLAERLRQGLEGEGHAVAVHHLDVHRPPPARPGARPADPGA